LGSPDEYVGCEVTDVDTLEEPLELTIREEDGTDPVAEAYPGDVLLALPVG